MVCFKLKMICCCLLWLPVACFFIYTRRERVHLICCWHCPPFSLQIFFFFFLFTPIAEMGKEGFFLHAYTHFNWSFEVVPKLLASFFLRSACFPVQSFTFYRVRFFRSLPFSLFRVYTSIAWKCCSDCHFKHFIGFRNSDWMQSVCFCFCTDIAEFCQYE